MSLLQKLDKNAERWMLLVFYVILVLTMAVEYYAVKFSLTPQYGAKK